MARSIGHASDSRFRSVVNESQRDLRDWATCHVMAKSIAHASDSRLRSVVVKSLKFTF